MLLPDWPGDAPELAIDQGERLNVLRVLPAGELGQWLTVDHVNLAALIVAVKRDFPKWVERGLEASDDLAISGRLDEAARLRREADDVMVLFLNGF